MTVHLLWWNNREEFDDHAETLLGVYADADQALEAEIHYERLRGHQWPFNEDGAFWQQVVTVGEHLFSRSETGLDKRRARKARPDC